MIKRFLLAFLLGAPWALSFSPFEWWWVAPIQLVLLAVLVDRQADSKSAFLTGWAFGFAANLIGVGWLYISLHRYGGLPGWMAGLSVALFSLYLGLFAGLSAWGFRYARLQTRLLRGAGLCVLLGASVWTFFEWLRGYLFTGFAWLTLGDAWVDSPFAGLLPWLGNHGATFLFLLSAGSFWVAVQAVRQNQKVGGLLCLGPAILVLVLANTEPDTRPAAAFNMVGVQPNVDQSIKFDVDMLVSNMEGLFAKGDEGMALLPPQGDLIFPETVNPLVWVDTPLSWLERFRDYAADRPGGVITGATLKVGQHYFNSIVLLDGNETGDALIVPEKRHEKRHLVPFGEMIPWGFGWFVRMLNMPMGEFTPGSGPLRPLMTQDNAVAATVCYEDTFAGEFADLIRNATTEPTLFLSLSNLAWFGQSWALDQHAQMGRTRSAEHRKPTLRVTNTGVSGLVDIHGRWVKRVDPWQGRVWNASFEGRKGLTFFAKYGQYVWFLMWSPLLVLLVVRSLGGKAYNRGQIKE